MIPSMISVELWEVGCRNRMNMSLSTTVSMTQSNGECFLVFCSVCFHARLLIIRIAVFSSCLCGHTTENFFCCYVTWIIMYMCTMLGHKRSQKNLSKKSVGTAAFCAPRKKHAGLHKPHWYDSPHCDNACLHEELLFHIREYVDPFGSKHLLHHIKQFQTTL